MLENRLDRAHKVRGPGWRPASLWAQALCIQLSSVVLVSLLYSALSHSVVAFELRHLGINLAAGWPWLLLHLLLVSCLAVAWQMPRWWRWIHWLFPLAVIGMQAVHVPAGVYLTGFLLTLALYWSVYRTRVPFYPSFPATWRAMHQLLMQYAGPRSIRVLDIGSGLGDVSLFLARQRPQDTVSGIEIAPLPWLVSRVRARLSGARVTFHRGDYQQLDFASLNVVFAYLSPAVMAEVWHKVQGEMHAGSLFISSEFPVPGVAASRVIYPADHAPALYIYTL